MTGEILVIEDEPYLSKELTSALNEAGFSVAAVLDFPEALRKLTDFKPDLVIMEAVLPSGDGMDACCQLRNTLGVRVPVVLIGSEESSDELWGRVMEADADLYLVKPLSYWELVARVKAILRRCRRQVI
ncbi:Alkaline phosphatase synthesis transcriptional regulatory protein PhoP [subsurface metagenome]